MFKRSSYLALCFAACVVVMGLLAGCGGNLAPATPTATIIPLVPTEPVPTATEVETEVESTPTQEASTPTAVDTPEPTATVAMPAEETETPEAPSTPTRDPFAVGTPSIPSSDAEQVIKERATEAIEALKNKDMAKLASLVHPDKGVGFAPYSYIDDTNLTLTREELENALTDSTIRTWGAYDGTGDPMALTFAEYFDKFIYNHDFAAAPNINYNQFKGHGNSINNVFAVYPEAVVVEYHFPGFDPQYEGMDWQALYLVFEKHTDGNWYLVHINHAQWTI